MQPDNVDTTDLHELFVIDRYPPISIRVLSAEVSEAFN